MEKSFYRPRIMYAPYPFPMMQEEYSQMPPPMLWPRMEYPPEVVDEESELDFWKSMYPDKIKKIQASVEEICDKMDYNGSVMYDEWPDQVALRRIASIVYEMLMEDESLKMEADGIEPEIEPLLESSQMRRPKPRPQKNPWLKDIVDVLLFQEMHRRRCRRGNCRGNHFY